MKKILVILILCLFVLGCFRRNDGGSKFCYVIKHPENILREVSDGPIHPLPPKSYYGYFNFILIDSNTIYLHYRYIYNFCGTGIDNSKPPKVFLVPDSLIKMRTEDIQHFIETSINESLLNNRNFYVSISSATDTIRHKAFNTLTDFFTSKKFHRYIVRNWTEEEMYVTTAKMNNKTYNPDSVKWYIGFDNQQ